MVPISNERQARALAPVKADPAEVRETFAEAERRGDTSGAGLASVVSERKTVTEKSTTTIDPETGEIVGEEGTPSATGSGAGEGVAPGQTREALSPSSSAPQTISCPTCGGACATCGGTGWVSAVAS